MAAIKLASALPRDELNGLEDAAKAMVTDPTLRVLVVAELDVQKITHDVDHDQDVPTARVHAIEVIADPDDAEQVRALLQAGYRDRNGQDEEIPYDQAAGDLDVETDQGTDGEYA